MIWTYQEANLNANYTSDGMRRKSVKVPHIETREGEERALARTCDPFSHILLILKDVQSSPVTRFVNTSLIADNM